MATWHDVLTVSNDNEKATIRHQMAIEHGGNPPLE
jgi:hypothetical protein